MTNSLCEKATNNGRTLESFSEAPSPKRRHVASSEIAPVSAESLRHMFNPGDVAEWLAHYHDKGFVIIRGLIDPVSLEEARSGLNGLIDELADRLLKQGLINNAMTDEPFETRLLRLCESCPDELPNLYRKELHRRELFGFLCHPEVLKVVKHILSSADEIRIFPNYSARPKTPYKIHDVTWHQDAGLQADGGPSSAPVEERLHAYGIGSVVNCWSPLVSARASNGAMKFVPESQKLGILPHVNLGKYEGKDASGSALKAQVGTYMTGVEPTEMAKIEGSAIDIEMDPGDVVLFSNLLVHRGGQNASDHIRWSFDWRFQNAAKPTCRPDNGHVVWSRTGTAAASTAEQWARLCLS